MIMIPVTKGSETDGEEVITEAAAVRISFLRDALWLFISLESDGNAARGKEVNEDQKVMMKDLTSGCIS